MLGIGWTAESKSGKGRWVQPTCQVVVVTRGEVFNQLIAFINTVFPLHFFFLYIILDTHTRTSIDTFKHQHYQRLKCCRLK